MWPRLSSQVQSKLHVARLGEVSTKSLDFAKTKTKTLVKTDEIRGS